jgi:hypothetical protein
VESLCTSQVLAAVPWFAVFLAFYAAVLLTSRIVAEVFFLVARLCGQVPGAGVAKVIGKVAWEFGRCFKAIGFGTPRRFIDAQFVPKPPKGMSPKWRPLG